MKGFAARLLPYALAFFSSLCIMVLELVAGRLVARHVGSSLVVWTSVIGIMLGGICLGNVLGGRLADRAEPRRLIGPLYALGAALTLGCLWANSVVGLLPGLDSVSWNLRTVLVVTLDFLAPGTVLGMIGPVVAKMAVVQARKSGSALGDVYFWGAVGSIAGTFLAGYYLIYLVPTSTIVTVVAAALTLLAGAMFSDRAGAALGLAASAALAAGSVPAVDRMLARAASAPGGIRMNAVTLLGHALTLALGLVALGRLRAAMRPIEGEAEEGGADKPGGAGVRLGDLAALAFVGSLAFMALEMVAGRLVTRHLGSSVYGWTSVIGVLLGGLSLGNFLGGKLADFIRREAQASHLFLVASALTLLILPAETPRGWFARILGDGSLLSRTEGMQAFPWWARVLTVVTSVFLLPAIAMGTVGPVVAKLAVDRVKRGKRTGTAIGQVYAWGMVGSILGTFLAGFVLIDLLGTKGLILALATMLAIAATWLGTAWHAAWAGLPLGLCIVAFAPVGFLSDRAVDWGLRDPRGNPSTTKDETAYTDESNYYFIKVYNDASRDPDHPSGPPLLKRTLVLDSLIHGYDILGHPEVLEYDYEFIYAQATERFRKARARAGNTAPLRTMFLGGGSYTFPRYLQHVYPGTSADVAEIDPAVTETNHVALGLARDTPIRTTWGDARQFVERRRGRPRYDIVFGDAFNDFSVPYHLTTREFNDKVASMLAPDGVYMINIIDLYLSDDRAEKKGMKLSEARGTGAFLGAWVKTAKLTFPHIAVFGTHDVPGKGSRETFVVVASKAPLDLKGLGRRKDDRKFTQSDENFVRDPYPDRDLAALDLRSRGIILTDDYAPVENLLAPVAATRAKD